MIDAEQSLDELCTVASSNVITQEKFWTTNKEFKKDSMLIAPKLPFTPLVIPQYKKT